MTHRAITVLIWFLFATTTTLAAAQGAPSSKSASSSSSSKTSLSQIRSLVHDLQGRNEKLRDLNDQYRSLVEQKPQPEGGSPEQKQADDAQLAKWSSALERLLRRIDEARAAVVETKQQLDQSAGEPLPTALAKDVANARNEAEAQRAQAEQALAKKPAKQKPSKQKPVVEKPAPPIPDDL